MAKGNIGTWSKIRLHSSEIMDAYNKNVVQLLQAKMSVEDFAKARNGAANPLLQE